MRFDLDFLERLAHIMDDAWEIPFLKIKIGLDPILGLFPGIGDLIPALTSIPMIYYAFKNQYSKQAILKMIGNVAIDILIGIVPILGDALDFAWKANLKNIAILKSHKPTIKKVV